MAANHTFTTWLPIILYNMAANPFPLQDSCQSVLYNTWLSIMPFHNIAANHTLQHGCQIILYNITPKSYSTTGLANHTY
ncbi:hypothetical protein RRG08_065280 [Elysia crispata]|uniref:Uncharacterized protein n=1 Tax=Elysia crispata TaxID=231223 RepID=A0AAE0Z4F4_9GAST|nr:hypothetical protein RRG08_065280 [Elysia crispata]